MSTYDASMLLEVRNLRVSFPVRHAGRSVRVRALDDVGFALASAETLGIVGESGSGKSTLARTLLRLNEPEHGQVRFRGLDLLSLNGTELQRARARLQMIFQDGIAALDPRQRIGATLEEPLQVLKPELSEDARRERVLTVLARVGLEPQHLQRYPHQLSGGQAQRIGIARALIVEPELIVCDEPLSSLDVSIKAQITALLLELKRELRLSLIFIAHDLPAVQLLSDRVLVLYLGRVMEIAARDALFQRPRHPYTRALLQAVPVPDPRIARQRRAPPLAGEIPSSLSPPSGCVFRTRCPHAIERCALELPVLRQLGDSQVACHRAEEL
ncbi:MAG TPA: oligopeptide/dipeptide ABC transporter ATP-binding protein [Steroidobacteraceae bacterium]|nr:oligopeptide/dipeptide ABC transporter ATP-binding protein [Steroidobacteraceae bacterium]